MAPSIDLDDHGRVFVSDEHLNRISIYDEEGGYRYHWGRSGSEEGQLNGPSGIAIDSPGVIWVVDSLNHRVQSFSQIGEFQSKFGKRGGGDGELEMPWGICVDRQDNIYVADWETTGCKNSPVGENCSLSSKGQAPGWLIEGAVRRSRGLGRGRIRN